MLSAAATDEFPDAELFRGLDDDVLALADSFALEQCVWRDWLRDALASG
jgi:endoglucanase